MHALQKIEPVNQLQKTTFKGVSQGHELDQVVKTCELLSKAPFYQKMGAGGILAIWLTAREMGLPPMMCLNGGLYTFSGQVSLSGKVINMLIIQAGHRVDVIHLDNKSCKLKFFRSDRKKGEGDTYEYEFNMEMAKEAGLTSKKNWQTNPRDMLFNRAISGGSIKFMPDVTCGAYAIGELPGDGNIIDDSTSDLNLPEQNMLDVKQLYMDSQPDKKTISIDQAMELAGILLQCSEDCQKRFNDYINKTLKIDILDEMPIEHFEKSRKNLIKERDAYQKQLAEKEMTITVEPKGQ
jgi:hypothetical protein